MTPASPNFVRLLRIVCARVDERNAAETLARLADEKAELTSELVGRLGRASPTET